MTKAPLAGKSCVCHSFFLCLSVGVPSEQRGTAPYCLGQCSLGQGLELPHLRCL